MSPPTLRAAPLLVLTIAAAPSSAQEVKLEFGGSVPFGATGQAVGGGADVDGDGTPDVVVGSTGAGRVDVLSGVDFTVLRTHLAPSPNIGTFGRAVDLVGDVDGDGRGDVAVATPIAGSGQEAVAVYSGQTGGPIHSFTGHVEFGGYGRSVRGPGDVDGDGRADVLIGSWSFFGADKGAVELRSGATGAILFQWEGLSLGESLGTSVSAAGDVDGDGFLDLAAGGAGLALTSLPHAGVAEVYSGKDGVRIHRWFGTVEEQEFGRAVGGGGDLDADGFDDVVVGSPGGGPFGRGMVEFFTGGTGAATFAREGTFFSKSYGFAVAIVGDANGDGRADVAVGDPDASFSPGVQLLSGSDGSILASVHNELAFDRTGQSVSAVGDLDGDGLAEFVHGASRKSVGGVSLGVAAVVMGLCARYLPFGEGCSTSTYVPALAVTGCPGPGGTGALEIRHAPGDSTAFLLFGNGAGSTVLDGCELLLTGLAPVVVPLPLGGAGQGSGEITVPVTLPAVVPPTTFTMQAVVVDASLPLSTTNGLEVTLP
ncbi:MAG: FG-GAP repeat domain-containing protein [Planctomycetota bacterium JB042]